MEPIKMLETMLEMQQAMNEKVDAQWKAKGFEWYRAIWVECAELLDHYGWKWWKKQTPDTEQVALELVDIFHFGLSCFLSDSDKISDIAATIEKQFAQAQAAQTKQEFRETIESLAQYALSQRHFDVQSFYHAMSACDMTLEVLFKQYVGKNTLNFFRQDNGYKEGTYHKVWAGKEDNEHLADILSSLSFDVDNYPETVYQTLQSKYQALSAS